MLHHATRRPAARVAALAVAGLVALGACSADDGDDADDGPAASLIPPESAAAETTTSTSTTAATGATEPTTTARTPTAFAPSAREAVDGLRAAWEAGDQAGALALAPGEVVDQLFAVPADGFETYGCDTGEFETSTCNFRNRSTEAFIVVTAVRSDAGWQIASVDINLD